VSLYDFRFDILVNPGHHRMPALLGAIPVCASADHENRAHRLRGGNCLIPDFSLFTAGRSSSSVSATDIYFTNSERGITAMKLNLMVKDLNAAIAAAGGGGGTVSGTLIYGEVPAGTLNGINKVFTTASAYRANLLSVFLNGVRQRRTNDYTETTNNSFTFVVAPVSGDILSVDYMGAGFGAAVTAFGSQTPANSNAGSYTLGNTLQFGTSGQIIALLYYRVNSGMTAGRVLRIWNTSGTQLASAATSGETGIGWRSATLTTPLAVSASQSLVVTTDLAAGDYYCYTAPPVTCDTAQINWIEGRYIATVGSFPTTSDPHNYFTDVSFQPAL
jgi:hypothetical protein